MLSPADFIIGGWGHPDNLGNHWLLVWVAENVSAGTSIIHNDQYYVPFGDYPWLAGNGSEGILFWPFYSIFGWPVGVSILLTVLFVATGFAGFALGRVTGAGPWLSLVPSSIILSTPYLSRELSGGRFSQFDIFWLTAALATFLWIWKKPYWHIATICGVFVGITSILYWYYGFFFIIAAALIVISSLIAKCKVPWKMVGLAAAVSLAIAGPVLFIYLSNWHLIPGVAESQFPAVEAYHDALDPTWPIIHQHGRRAGATQSFIVLFLTVFAIWKVVIGNNTEERRHVLIGLSFVLIFWLLAMGPNTPFFAWVYSLIGPLKRFWWPSRHLVMTNFGYAILAVMGLKILLSQQKLQMPTGIIISIVIPITIWFQGDRPFHAFHSPVSLPPEVYVELSNLPGEGIWQPPLNPKIATTQAPLLFQLYHKKRMINGHALWVDRVRPDGWDEMIAKHPLLGPLQAYEEADFEGEITITKEDIDFLLDLGISYAVIDKELFCTKTPQVLIGYSKVLSTFFGRPIVVKDGVRIWSLEQWTGKTNVDLPSWTWPKKVTKGTGTRGLWGPLHDSKVLITKD